MTLNVKTKKFKHPRKNVTIFSVGSVLLPGRDIKRLKLCAQKWDQEIACACIVSTQYLTGDYFLYKGGGLQNLYIYRIDKITFVNNGISLTLLDIMNTPPGAVNFYIDGGSKESMKGYSVVCKHCGKIKNV